MLTYTVSKYDYLHAKIKRDKNNELNNLKNESIEISESEYNDIKNYTRNYKDIINYEDNGMISYGYITPIINISYYTIDVNEIWEEVKEN